MHPRSSHPSSDTADEWIVLRRGPLNRPTGTYSVCRTESIMCRRLGQDMKSVCLGLVTQCQIVKTLLNFF